MTRHSQTRTHSVVTWPNSRLPHREFKQIELEEKVHYKWDCAEEENHKFDKHKLRIRHQYWEKVRQTQLILLGPQTTGQQTTGGNGSGTAPSHPKKKKNRQKKGSKPPVPPVNTANTVTKGTTDNIKGSDKPKMPVSAPTYCFRCGQESHDAKNCPHKGDLKCKYHADSVSHLTEACNL